MLQTTLSVPLDVKPESAQQLDGLVDQFRRREDDSQSTNAINFERLLKGIPTLHFMSMSVFQDPAYDPIFIIEVNCDGAPGPFWAHLEKLAGNELRDMLRCCKKPLDHNGKLYDVVTAPGSNAPVAPYLEAMTEPPSVFHHGNRGLARDRIIKEADLFRSVRTELDSTQKNRYFSLSAAQIHSTLRAQLLPQFSWLDQRPAPRFTFWERAADFLRLVAYAAIVWGVLSLPGTLAAQLLPAHIYLVSLAILCAFFCWLIYRLHEALPDTDVKTNFSLLGALFRHLPAIAVIFLVPLALFLACVWFLFAGLQSVFDWSDAWFYRVAEVVSLGSLGLFVVVPGLILWLRALELGDSSQYKAQIDPVKVADIMQHEDWVSQNHMGSVVHIRPGVLRTLIVKFGHRGLGLFLRWQATAGYLGSMRTVHFAHWAFLNNNSRLLFFSNYDQSWGSYLDDFIEKAHVGLTLAWGCGVGFPPTRFLIYDGASHGRLFKNWALASRTVSRFWVSAYPDLSVDQIERNYRIAKGLSEPHLKPEDADEWARDL
ncbi:MAG: hypothetical protein AAFP80_08330 [Pseudomonadota bacterium]